MTNKPSIMLPEDDDDHIVPIDYDPAAQEAAAAEARAAEAAENDDPMTDLEMCMDMLTAFDIQFTLIQDEAGSTVEIEGGARGTVGFTGFAMTFNFKPAPTEKFLFIGAAR